VATSTILDESAQPAKRHRSAPVSPLAQPENTTVTAVVNDIVASILTDAQVERLESPSGELRIEVLHRHHVEMVPAPSATRSRMAGLLIELTIYAVILIGAYYLVGRE
jgi:hypothetical protein